jgi:hypothetical protein
MPDIWDGRREPALCCRVRLPICLQHTGSMLLVQELKAKGIGAEDVDHGLRSVFGEAMRVEVVPADEADDEGVTVDTRFGKRSCPAASTVQQLPQE